MSNSAGGGDGQLDAFALRVEAATSERNTLRSVRNYRNCAMTYGSRSPAALGCLLALVREAWGDSQYRAVVDVQDLPDRGDANELWAVEILRWSDEYREYERDFDHEFSGPTPGDALAVALEAGQ